MVKYTYDLVIKQVLPNTVPNGDMDRWVVSQMNLFGAEGKRVIGTPIVLAQTPSPLSTAQGPVLYSNVMFTIETTEEDEEPF